MLGKIYKYLLFFMFICMASCALIQSNNEEYKLKIQKLENENKKIKAEQILIENKNKKLDSKNQRLVNAGKELLNELTELLKKYEDLNNKNVTLTKQNFDLYRELFQKKIDDKDHQKDLKKLENVKNVFDYQDKPDSSLKTSSQESIISGEANKKEKLQAGIMKRINQKRMQLIDKNLWTHKDELKYFNLKTNFEENQESAKSLKLVKQFEVELNERIKD